jgi:pilus assembly protein Flp/PilA
MKNALTKFLQEEDGATAIEYGLIAGLIAVVIIVALTSIGTNLDRIYNLIVTALIAIK